MQVINIDDVFENKVLVSKSSGFVVVSVKNATRSSTKSLAASVENWTVTQLSNPAR